MGCNYGWKPNRGWDAARALVARGRPSPVEAEAEQAMEAEQAKTRAGLLRALSGVVNPKTEQPVCSTGLRALDDALGGGLFRGVTVLGGMPGVGKTTLAAQICARVMAGGETVAEYFDLDSATGAQATKRILSAVAGWPCVLRDFMKPDTLDDATLQKLAEAAALFDRDANGPGLRTAWGFRDFDDLLGFSYLDGTPHQPFTEGMELYRADVNCISTQLDAIEHRPMPKLAVVDSLQKVRSDAYPERDETTRIKMALEDLQHVAGSMPGGMALLLTSTLSRAGYANPSSMAALNGSSDIEYSAETVMILANTPEEQLSPERRDWVERHPGHRYVTAYMPKNRHGEEGARVLLVRDGLRGRFIEPGTKRQ